MTALIDGSDPTKALPYTLTLPRQLVERLKSALDVGQSIIDDQRWREEQDTLRGILVAELRRTTVVRHPVRLYARDVQGELRRVGGLDVFAVKDENPQGIAWAARRALVYNVAGDEFTDDDVSEWEA